MDKSLEQLTFYERNTLNLIVEGKTNREISEILSVPLGTAKSYVQSILNKKGIHDRKLLIVEYHRAFNPKNSPSKGDNV